MKKIFFFLAIISFMACNNTKAQNPSESAATIYGTGATPSSVIHSGADTVWARYTIPASGNVTMTFTLTGATGSISGTMTRWVSNDGNTWTPYIPITTADSISNTLALPLPSVPPSTVTGTAVYSYTKSWVYPIYHTTVGNPSVVNFPWKYMLVRYISASIASPSTVTASGRVLVRRTSPY